MSPADTPPRLADCTNYPLCGQARGKVALEWYAGPGEYCPECGEKLTPRDTARPSEKPLAATAAQGSSPASPAIGTPEAAPPPNVSRPAPPAGPAPSPPPAPSPLPINGAAAHAVRTTRGEAHEARATTGAGKATPEKSSAANAGGGTAAKTAAAKVPTVKSPPTAPASKAVGADTAASGGRPAPPVLEPRPASARKWLSAIAAIFIVSGAIGYAVYRGTTTRRAPAGTLSVCAIPNALGLARDLILAYSAKTGTPEDRFSLGGSASGAACDLRFTTAPETPGSVIASDGVVVIVNPINNVSRLSERQLRDIFSGSVRDWSQLGGEPGAIVPLLPDASTEEAKLLGASLFFGLNVDRGVRRLKTSADVTRAVTGADRDSSRAIGMVTFSQALAAKVVPIAYLPAPSVLTIASRRYPYVLSIAIESPSGSADPAIAGLIDYAHSSFGAAIVQVNGLIPRTGV